MSPSDASPSEMPGFPFPGRPGGEHDEPLLDMILGRRALPPDAPPEIHDLARMLAALSGPAEPGELAGEADARAAFAGLGPLSPSHPSGPLPVAARVLPPSGSPARAGVSHQVRRPTRHRRRRWARGSVRPRVGLASALVAALAGLVILAGYAGDLPGPVQRLAHVTVAAPAPANPRVTPTLDYRQGVRHPTQPATTPERHPTHRATASATGRTSTPRYTPRTSPSDGYHPGVEGCGNDPWWPYQPSSPGRGYHGLVPQAQPANCPSPDTQPSPVTQPTTLPSLGPDQH